MGNELVGLHAGGMHARPQKILLKARKGGGQNVVNSKIRRGTNQTLPRQCACGRM